MKISTNKRELIELKACKEGFKIFVNAHGDNDALLSQCLESNGWDDVWWLLHEVEDHLTDSQKRDLRLLACYWAESVLDIFEKEHPNDNRPRLAIKASRDFADGLIASDQLAAARAAAAWAARAAAAGAARVAAWAARDAAWAAAGAAARAAWAARAVAAAVAAGAAGAARDAAGAARVAAGEVQNKDLMNLFLKWESQA
jgi:hypothetical protein